MFASLLSPKTIGSWRAWLVAKTWAWHPNWRQIAAIKHRSMLDYGTLALLFRLARKVDGAILEIGPYVGGATVALALDAHCPVIAVEVGGSGENPRIRSDDIIRDLHRTLRDWHVEDRVVIIEGWSNLTKVVEEVQNVLNGRRIGLLLFDANGEIEENFTIYRSMMQDDAIVVCDDFVCDGPNVKEGMVAAWVRKAVASGTMQSLGVFGGTWFGRLRKSAATDPV